MKRLREFLRRDDAATAVEYAVLLAMILIGVIAAVGSVGTETGGLWGNVETELNTAGLGS